MGHSRGSRSGRGGARSRLLAEHKIQPVNHATGFIWLNHAAPVRSSCPGDGATATNHINIGI